MARRKSPLDQLDDYMNAGADRLWGRDDAPEPDRARVKKVTVEYDSNDDDE